MSQDNETGAGAFRIGFCTSSMNRLWQARLTLPPNLAALRGTPHFLALCNYNSQDELEQFVQQFRADMEAGTLVYFHTKEPATFHMSKGKNVSHRLALTRRPDLLFNLDADNYISPEGIARILEVFRADLRSCLHHWSGSYFDGSFGRICVSAESWRTLGGYDETLQPMSFQDVDFLFRARALGLKHVRVREAIPEPVANSAEDKLRNTSFASGKGRAYDQMTIDNSLHVLGQPLVLRAESQTRYTGILNFDQPVTI